MHIGPPPSFPPFDADQVGPTPDAFLARLCPMLLSLGAAALIVGGVLFASLLGAQPVRGDGLSLLGP